MADFNIDFYEKSLTEQKSKENIDEERRKAFEQKYINRINQEYQQTLATFKEDSKQKKEQIITETFQALSRQLVSKEGFEFGERQQAVLRLKLARHFQNNETIDLNVLLDAITETPNFINTDKGSLFRLLEIHEEKTLQKIAEIRKERAEIKGKEEFNPYEALFETKSGDYYIKRGDFILNSSGDINKLDLFIYGMIIGPVYRISKYILKKIWKTLEASGVKFPDDFKRKVKKIF